jgi:polyribonucleotide nucleotidyltransferase
MNHIELYENTINDLSIDFDTRHYIKQFNSMTIDQALNVLEKLERYIRLKQIDQKWLTESITQDSKHN